MAQCKKCGKNPSFLGHDHCFSNLPNVVFACCGHGDIESAYIGFYDGPTIHGAEALEWAQTHKASLYEIAGIYVHTLRLNLSIEFFFQMDRFLNKLGYGLVGVYSLESGKN